MLEKQLYQIERGYNIIEGMQLNQLALEAQESIMSYNGKYGVPESKIPGKYTQDFLLNYSKENGPEALKKLAYVEARQEIDDTKKIFKKNMNAHDDRTIYEKVWDSVTYVSTRGGAALGAISVLAVPALAAESHGLASVDSLITKEFGLKDKPYLLLGKYAVGGPNGIIEKPGWIGPLYVQDEGYQKKLDSFGKGYIDSKSALYWIKTNPRSPEYADVLYKLVEKSLAEDVSAKEGLNYLAPYYNLTEDSNMDGISDKLTIKMGLDPKKIYRHPINAYINQSDQYVADTYWIDEDQNGLAASRDAFEGLEGQADELYIDGLLKIDKIFGVKYNGQNIKLNPNGADSDRDGLFDSEELKGFNIIVPSYLLKEVPVVHKFYEGGRVAYYLFNPSLSIAIDGPLKMIHVQTDPSNPDTDGDGKTDYTEVKEDFRDPTDMLDSYPGNAHNERSFTTLEEAIEDLHKKNYLTEFTGPVEQYSPSIGAYYVITIEGKEAFSTNGLYFDPLPA